MSAKTAYLLVKMGPRGKRLGHGIFSEPTPTMGPDDVGRGARWVLLMSVRSRTDYGRARALLIKRAKVKFPELADWLGLVERAP